MNGFVNWKTIAALIILVVIIVEIICRIMHIKTIQRNDNTKSNVVDFKEFLENNIDCDPELPILFEDSDVDYDILGRERLISYLYNSIINCHTEHSFVIGLEGEWGSGKTTIINNVKRCLAYKKDEIIVIDEFDPWTYGNEENILKAMYDTILSHSGFKINTIEGAQIIDEVTSILANESVSVNLLKSLSKYFVGGDAVGKVKDKIQEYLSTENKRIVFFIDNIDRLDSDKILFLLKVIAQVFDFRHIVYVLAYDKNRVNGILADSAKIDEHYLEKIVQQVISIPNFQSDEKKNIYSTCFEKMFRIYNFHGYDVQIYKALIDYVTSKAIDIRKFKRLINSSISFVLSSDFHVDKLSLISVQAIQFFNNQLYEDIFQNKRFFISEDKHYDSDLIYDSFISKKFETEATSYFEKLVNDLSYAEANLLQVLFPHISKYSKRHGKYNINTTETKTDKTLPKLYSAKYFDLYFNFTNNQFLSINSAVCSFVKVLNSIDKIENLFNMWEDLLKSSPDVLREWLVQFTLYQDDISSEKCFPLLVVFWKTIYRINNTTYFMSLSSREYVLSSMGYLLFRLSDEEFLSFIETIKTDYKRIRILKSAIYWYKNTAKNHNNTKEHRLTILLNTHKEMCRTVINEKINLYEDKYYSFQNIFGLFEDDSPESIQKVKEYINSIISDNIFFRIIADTLSISIGGKYNYGFSKKNLENFFEDDNEVERYFNNTNPKTEQEEFLAQVYEAYKSGNPNSYDEHSVLSDDWIEFSL